MSETPHLLPCPFCGERGFLVLHGDGVAVKHRCEGRLDRPCIEVTDQTQERAYAAWNRRADLSGSVGEGVLRSRDPSHTATAAMRASPCTDQDGEGS